MKKQLLFLTGTILVMGFLFSCNDQSGKNQNKQTPEPMFQAYVPAGPSNAVDVIMGSYSGKQFKKGPVPDGLIESILKSGQKAPSAMNAQPWHFTVVKNSKIAGQLVSRNYAEGAVVIIVSGRSAAKVGVNIAFDCALATQNMYIAAQSLGLGAHLYYGGVQNINNSMKPSLGIPDDYEAQIIMLVGYLDDGVDAATAASSRNPLSNNVNYID